MDLLNLKLGLSGNRFHPGPLNKRLGMSGSRSCPGLTLADHDLGHLDDVLLVQHQVAAERPHEKYEAAGNHERRRAP